MEIPAQFSFVKWLKEDVVALVFDKYGKKIVLKANSNAKYLEEFSKLVFTQTRTLKEIMPQISSINQEFTSHEYINGQLSGDTKTLFGFSQDAFSLINPKTLTRALYEMQALSTAAVFVLPKPLVPVAGMSKKRFVLEERQSDWYLSNLEETRNAIDSQMGANYFANIDNFLRKNTRIIDANSRYLVNGDLHPENLMIKCLIAGQAKDFLLSDWDLLHFNNPAYDLADLTVWGWRNKIWQESLVAEFLALFAGNKEEFDICFKFCQVYLAAHMINHASLMLGTNLNLEATENAKGLLESSCELLKKTVI